MRKDLILRLEKLERKLKPPEPYEPAFKELVVELPDGDEEIFDMVEREWRLIVKENTNGKLN